MNKTQFSKILHIIGLVTSFGFIAFLLFMFIGETISTINGTAPPSNPLDTRDILTMICILIIFPIGTIIAIKRKQLGGWIIIASFILFNVITLIFDNRFDFFFWFLCLFGSLFLVSSWLDE